MSASRYIYGDAEAQTIVEQFKTQLALSCGASEGGGTARLVSILIGEREVERIETSTSHNRGQDGVSTTTSYRRQVEQAVLPSEIMQLPDLSGYLRVSGQAVWMKVAFEPIELEEHTSPAEPIAQAELVQPSSPIPVLKLPPAPAAPAIDPQAGYPRMSFPFSPEQAFNLTAEFFGAEHPQRPPAPQLEG